MSEPPVDPRLPKKQRRRDETPPDPLITEATLPHAPMDCEDANRAKSQVSYKDMLTGSSEENLEEELLSLDDDDIDLLDDDISVGESEGIPFIIFSDRVQSLALQSMDYTLVVKILGLRVGYNVLHNRIHAIWKPAHPLKLVDIENDYFLVKFSASECCPKKSESSSEAPPVVPDSPTAPVLPQDPYGPWMLVEKRQRRPPKKSATLPSSGSDFHVDNSRFNPIYLDSNNDDNLANTIETSQVLPQAGIPTEPPTSQVQIQKHAIVPLGPKSLDMPIPRNFEAGTSSSRSSKGRVSTHVLNSKKHTALSLPMMDGPTVGTEPQPPKNRSDNSVDMAHASTAQLRLSARSSPTGNNVSTFNGPLAMIE
ncbi:hypothetical protein V6N12_005689 [Hibiscus sabdariffa]|uniref:DUF4283 domain-containing protein n=2 Tax=Hibiscus sabdariffa TaxID=183260 RepID=A0ABR2BB92_9ROSI